MVKRILAVVVVGITSLLFVGAALPVSAATANSLYLGPTTGNYTVGDTISVSVRENSGTTAVTAAEADFTYPTSQLQYISMDFSGSAFKYQPPSGNGATGGTVSMQNAGPGLSGDQLVGVVSFKVLQNGSAALSFTSSSKLLDANGNNILTSTTGANYALAVKAAPAPTPTPVPAPAPTPVSVPSGATNSSAGSAVALTPKGSTTPVTVSDNSQVQVTTPLTVQPTNTGNDVTKVEYYLNNKRVATVTQAPYEYQVKTADLRNGKYTLTTKTYYNSAPMKSVSQTLDVKNAFGFKQLWLQLIHYKLILFIVVLLLAVISLLISRWKSNKYTPPSYHGGYNNIPQGGEVVVGGKPGVTQPLNTVVVHPQATPSAIVSPTAAPGNPVKS